MSEYLSAKRNEKGDRNMNTEHINLQTDSSGRESYDGVNLVKQLNWLTKGFEK